MVAANNAVKRWDVYDIADELADVPGMLLNTANSAFVTACAKRELYDVVDKVKDLTNRLWKASKVEGEVGPDLPNGTVRQYILEDTVTTYTKVGPDCWHGTFSIEGQGTHTTVVTDAAVLPYPIVYTPEA